MFVKIYTRGTDEVDTLKKGGVTVKSKKIHTGKGYKCKDSHRGKNFKLTHKRWVNISKIAHMKEKEIYTEQFICGE